MEQTDKNTNIQSAEPFEPAEQTEQANRPVRRNRHRGISPFVLIVSVIGTALTTAILMLVLIGTVLDSTGLLGLTEMAALIENRYFYYDERVEGSDTLITGALRGMVSALNDRYATYYTAEQYAEQLQTESGEYEGLGITITESTEVGTPIVTVYEGSTAFQAGMLPGDIILSVNGNVTANLSTDAVKEFILKDGTENAITVLRGEETLDFQVAVGEVIVPVTVTEMLTGTVGYIRITGFHGHAVDETKQAIADLTEQGMEKLVLDLRDNPGGNLDVVLEIADLFLDKGALLTTVRSREGTEDVYSCKKDPIFDGEICVLVNGNSASASELLTGALKDYERAYIIGTQTYGKGIVQTTYSLAGTGGYVKFTTDAYFTPNGVCIQDEGITPDQIVELDEAYDNWSIASVPREDDTQLAAALQYLG